MGISNWALDPAKMNRAIMLSRGVPCKEDLVKTAKGICKGNKLSFELIESIIEPLAEGYYEVYTNQDREYFGLRDFYSLMKMILSIVSQTQQSPTEFDITYAIQRNFGGNSETLTPAVAHILSKAFPNLQTQCLIPPSELVFKAIQHDRDSRYILLLTKNHAALNIITEHSKLDFKNSEIIFGSSFPNDQEYSQVCLNIKRIKLAMELGQTVIMCNLNNLYESLYDALNQHYVYFGGSRYVDLGLGTHRVKCEVHENFHLIVIAEYKDALENFPIPLLNRLEKHYLAMETMLSLNQNKLVNELKQWIDLFSKVNVPLHKKDEIHQFKPSDNFVGFHEDVPASIVLGLLKKDQISQETCLDLAKEFFLLIATPDSVTRLESIPLLKMSNIENCCAIKQMNLTDAIQNLSHKNSLLQITTFSNLLTDGAKQEMCKQLQTNIDDISIISIQQIKTEEQLSKRIQLFLEKCKPLLSSQKVLILQAQITPDFPLDLIECTRFCILNNFNQFKENTNAVQNVCIALIWKISKIRGRGSFTGFPSSQWTAVHIDELKQDPYGINFTEWHSKKMSNAMEDKTLNWKRLIAECLPKAASVAYQNDDRSNDKRSVQSIEIIQSCVDLSDQFFNTLKLHIVSMIKNEETKLAEPEKWLRNLALNSRHLGEGNSFLKSIWFHFVEKTTPALSNLIVVCDRFSGLDLMNKNSEEWVTEIFEKLFHSMSLVPETKQYTSLNLTLKFPFSWKILEQLDTIYSDCNSNATLLQAGFERTYICFLLDELFEHCSEAVKKFVVDIVHLRLHSSLKQEVENIICECILNASEMHKEKRLSDTVDSEKTMKTFVLPTDIFAVFSHLFPRLEIFVELLDLNTELGGRISEYNQSNFYLDIWALDLSFDIQKPDQALIMDDSKRQSWVMQVIKLGCFLNKTKGLLQGIVLREEIARLLHSATQKYQQAIIIKTFYKHMLYREIEPQVREVVCNKITFLWQALHQLDFQTSEVTFNRILKALEGVSKTSNEKLQGKFKGIDKCLKCQEAIQDPVFLMCGHVGCKVCLKAYFDEKSGIKSCPAKGCTVIIQENYELQSEETLREIVAKHEVLRKHLNQFFLCLVQHHIFTNENAPHEKIINTLMAFILTKKLPKDGLTPRTKKLSPFSGDYIDSKPIIRSFLLQVIFKCNINTAEYHLNKFFEAEKDILGPTETNDLFLMILNCLEDAILLDREHESLEMKTAQNLTDSGLVSTHIHFSFLQPSPYSSRLESLRNTAKLRIYINFIADKLHNWLQKKEERAENVLKEAEQLIKNHSQAENLQKYLVRVFAAKYSIGAISEWKNSNHFPELMPKQLTVIHIQDFFVFLGKRYLEVREALKLALIKNDCKNLHQELSLNHSNLIWSMAFLHLTKIVPTQSQQKDTLVIALQHTPVVLTLWNEISENKCFIMQQLSNISYRHDCLLNLLWHLKRVFEEQPLFKFLCFFHNLINQPEKIKNCFLPTMPHDERLEIQEACRRTEGALKWYKCSKGHLYAIGECTQPVELGTCNECGEQIGGTNHFLARTGQLGNDIPGEVTIDETQSGHILGTAQAKSSSSIQRNLSGLEIAITRFLLHSSMLLGSQRNPESIHSTIQPQIKIEDQTAFLIDHLLLNIGQVSQRLGKSEDDAQILLHLVISNLIKNEQEVEKKGEKVDWVLSSKEMVNAWETKFAEQFLRTTITNHEHTITVHKDAIVRDLENESDNTLQNILHDTNVNMSQDPNHPQFWHVRNDISIHRLEAKLGTRHFEEKFPSIAKIFKEENALSNLHVLPKLNQLFSFVVNNFRHQFDIVDCDKMTIHDFTIQQLNDHERMKMIPVVDTFISTFNILKLEVFAYTRHGKQLEQLLHGDELRKETSPCSSLFPSSRGWGLAATLLLHFLIDKQNSVLRSFAGEEHCSQIDFAKITDTSVLIDYSSEDLHLILLANSEYSFNVGSTTNEPAWEVNELGMEQQVKNR